MFHFPAVIEGTRIRLEAFQPDHLPALRHVAIDPRVWEFMPWRIHSADEFDSYHQEMQELIRQQQTFIYTIFDKKTATVLGSSGYSSFDYYNLRTEIGRSWFNPSTWGSGINTEAKYLMLDACFRLNEIVRVEFKTRWTNLRSQKALEKIGATREGVLRWYRKNDDGSFRDAIMYSIIRPDWPVVKTHLEQLLAGYAL